MTGNPDVYMHIKNILYNIKNRYTPSRGYSLVELLVAIGVFATATTVISGAFVLSLEGQRKVTTQQIITENIRYITEIMSRELRTMNTNTGKIPIISPDGTRITFFSHMPHRDANKSLTFYFDTTNKQIMFDDDTTDGVGPVAISSSRVKVNNVQFVFSQPVGAPKQRITIILQTEAKGVPDSINTRINTQTTISPRSL